MLGITAKAIRSSDGNTFWVWILKSLFHWNCLDLFDDRSKSAFNEHKKRVHCPRQFACVACNLDFPSEISLLAHAKIHQEKQFTCSTCSNRFTNKTDLRNHNRIHNGVKPYICEVNKQQINNIYRLGWVGWAFNELGLMLERFHGYTRTFEAPNQSNCFIALNVVTANIRPAQREWIHSTHDQTWNGPVSYLHNGDIKG